MMTPAGKARIRVRVLVIDDDAAVCRRLAEWLTRSNYEPMTFTDPRRGLGHAARRPCELALIDLILPDEDGVAIITQLRTICPRARPIAMSAFPQAKQVRRAIRAGARDLLEKPVEREQLLRTLDRHLAEMGLPALTEAEFNRRLGARLRALRRAIPLTQQQVAEQAGITAAQLSQIECGKTATSTWTLARVAGTLRVTLDDLFRGW